MSPRSRAPQKIANIFVIFCASIFQIHFLLRLRHGLQQAVDCFFGLRQLVYRVIMRPKLPYQIWMLKSMKMRCWSVRLPWFIKPILALGTLLYLIHKENIKIYCALSAKPSATWKNDKFKSWKRLRLWFQTTTPSFVMKKITTLLPAPRSALHVD